MNRDLKLAARLVAIFLAFVLVCYLWLPLPTVVAQTSVSGGGGGAATSVTAAAFPLRAPDGTAAAPSYSFTNATGVGWFLSGTTQLVGAAAGNADFAVSAFGGNHHVANFTNYYAFSSGVGNNPNAQIERVANGVMKAGGGIGVDGWIQNAAGDKFLTSNHTNATATPTNITDLTVTVVSGRKYGFRFAAQVDNSTDADGLRFDFDGGSAGTTDFRVTCKVFANNATAATSQTTALATDITLATLTGTGEFECDGSFEPSGNGTFIPRAATNTTVSGTLTVFRGSWLWMKDQ